MQRWTPLWPSWKGAWACWCSHTGRCYLGCVTIPAICIGSCSPFARNLPPRSWGPHIWAEARGVLGGFHAGRRKPWIYQGAQTCSLSSASPPGQHWLNWMKYPGRTQAGRACEGPYRKALTFLLGGDSADHCASIPLVLIMWFKSTKKIWIPSFWNTSLQKAKGGKKINLSLSAVGGWLLMVTANTFVNCQGINLNSLNCVTDLIGPKFKCETESPSKINRKIKAAMPWPHLLVGVKQKCNQCPQNLLSICTYVLEFISEAVAKFLKKVEIEIHLLRNFVYFFLSLTKRIQHFHKMRYVDTATIYYFPPHSVTYSSQKECTAKKTSKIMFKWECSTRG